MHTHSVTHSTLILHETTNNTPQTARGLDGADHLLTPRSRPRYAWLEEDITCPGRVPREGEERASTYRKQTHAADDASNSGRRYASFVTTARGINGQYDGEAAGGRLWRSGDLLARCDRSLAPLQEAK